MDNIEEDYILTWGACAKTSLGVCLTKLKHKNLFNEIGTFWGW
jgi:hypothetical protein